MTVTQQAIYVYKCPSDDDPNSLATNYMVVTGPNTMFEGAEGCKISQIVDGTSNTIMIVEVTGQNTHWSEPRDLDIRQFQGRINAGGANELGSRHRGGAQVSMADASVQFMSESVDPQMLRQMVDPNDAQ